MNISDPQPANFPEKAREPVFKPLIALNSLDLQLHLLSLGKIHFFDNNYANEGLLGSKNRILVRF